MSDSNKQPTRPGVMLSGGSEGKLFVEDMRNAIHNLDNDVELIFGSTLVDKELSFYRFKWRGDKVLQIELNEAD